MQSTRCIAQPARRLFAIPATRSFARPLSTTANPESQPSTPETDRLKKRKPLTQEQRDFLSSAVCSIAYVLPPPSLGILLLT